MIVNRNIVTYVTSHNIYELLYREDLSVITNKR